MATYRLVGNAGQNADTDYNLALAGVASTKTFGRLQVMNLHTAAITLSVWIADTSYVAGGASAPTSGEIVANIIDDISLAANSVMSDIRFFLDGADELIIRSSNAAGLAFVVEATEQVE